MRKLLRMLRKFRFPYTPLVNVEVDKNAILHNLNEFKKMAPNIGLAPVLKSNAYGHGLVEVAKILDGENSPFFAIDSFHEALILRNEKIKTPLLIIGYTRNENIFQNRLKNISFTITSFDQLKVLSKELNAPATFHLKVDTGMGRQGVSLSELDFSIELIKSNPNIVLQGIVSHFADADNSNEVYTKEQIAKWNDLVEKMRAKFSTLSYYHISNSSGYFYNDTIKANVARVGIGLYGIKLNSKRDKNINLFPALQMKSIVSGIKYFERGDKIGYSLTYEVKDKIKAATLPLGYYEGIDRRLSNLGFVKIQNIFCPIIGRVSLNITTVDITKVSNLRLEDEVVVISKNSGDKNSVEQIAKMCDTTPYDILVHIPSQIRRTVV